MTMTVKEYMDPYHRIESMGFQNRYHYLEAAMGRNAGLLSAVDQERLLNARVAIPGLGGVGGIHLVTLARMGVGGFHLADFDTFEPANVNRQYGARIADFGKRKLDAMAAEARQINPFLDLALFPDGVAKENVTAFLQGADLVVDGIDFFAFEIRRLIFKHAREMGIPVITAGPMGFSAALLIFMPDRGMSFDEYFGIDDGMSAEEKLLAFFIGLAPRATHMDYIDATRIDMHAKRGPSIAAACQLCASVAATEAVRVLLKRAGIRPAPHYFQYDPLVRKFHQGQLRWGNRHPWQRFKLRRLRSLWLNGHRPLRADWKPAPLVKPRLTRLPKPVCDYILQAAVHAPSGDNCQPWRFRVKENRISLYLRPEVDQSLFNVKQYASLIACGAAVENMHLAATRYGFDGRIESFPCPKEPLHIADIDFKAAARAEDPLQRYIPERHTNRTAFDGRAIEPTILAAMAAPSPSIPGVELEWITDRERRQQVAHLVWQADRIRLENQQLHAHFMRMVRFSLDRAWDRRDGLPLSNLEAGPGGNLFLRLTRSWPVMKTCNHLGASRMIARLSYRGILQASAVGLLKCRDHEPAGFLEGGRALQRIWLTATRAGIDFQPMTAITLFWLRWQLGLREAFPASQQRQLEAIWPAYERLLAGNRATHKGHVMLFRIGYGQRVSGRTLRRPIQSFLRP